MSRQWETQGAHVRVVTYNCLAQSLGQGFVVDDASLSLAWEHRMPSIVAKICDALCRPLGRDDRDALEPFVVCLQEVDADCIESLLAELRTRLREYFASVEFDHLYAPHGGNKAHGQLVLWGGSGLVPAQAPKARAFVRPSSGFEGDHGLYKASQNFVIVSFPQFTLATAHLKAGRECGDERYSQMKQMLAAVERVDGRVHGPLWYARPLVVAGDLNDEPGSRALNEAAQAGLSRAWMGRAGYTWTTWKQRVASSTAPDVHEKKMIEDHVLVRNAVVVGCAAPPSEARGRLPNAGEPSDHVLVAARVVF